MTRGKQSIVMCSHLGWQDVLQESSTSEALSLITADQAIVDANWVDVIW